MLVQLRAVLHRARNNQRRAGLVDENRIDLVHDGEAEAALHSILPGERHIVPQVIKAKLIVSAVDHIGIVGCTFLLVSLPRGHHPDLQAQEVIQGPHPLRIAAGEVIVHSDEMHAVAGQSIEVGRQSRH